MNMDLLPRQLLLVDFYWCAKGVTWQREALPDAEGGAKHGQTRNDKARSFLVDFYWGAKGTPWQREALLQTPKAVRSAAPPDCPKSAERRRRDRRAGKARVKHEPAEGRELSCTDAILHGKSKSGRRATTRRVQELLNKSKT